MLIRNSSRKQEIREPSVGARWSEAEGELALELPTEDLWLCRFGRISRRRKGEGMFVPVRARDFSREAEWYRALCVSAECVGISQGRFFMCAERLCKYLQYCGFCM